ncbi:MAG: hypothetical protein ACL7AY_00025 [Candidatus Arsenophonus phytopathogenicus]
METAQHEPRRIHREKHQGRVNQTRLSLSVASLATREAIRCYCKQPASKRGKMISDCLNQAKRWAKSAAKHKH